MGVPYVTTEPHMRPADRRNRRWLRWLLVCGAVAIGGVVIGLGSANAGGPGPKSRVTRPDAPIAVVRGKHPLDGVQRGFPHSTAGAISAAAALVSEVYTLDPNYAAFVMSLSADSSYPNASTAAAAGARSLRKYLRIRVGGPPPAGYSAHFQADEFQVRNVTANKVMVVLLCKATFTLPGGGTRGWIGVYPFLMHWQFGDWKDAGHTAPTYLKLAATPYTNRAASLGWKALLR